MRLDPRLSDLTAEVANDADLLRQLVCGFGSPLNVLLPQSLADNANRARQVIDAHHVRHRLFMAHKPNRSQAVVREAASMPELGIDVASEGELRSALINGFSAGRIEATGPKNTAFLRLALQHDVTINADNIEEIHQVVAIRRALGSKQPARVLIRLADFRRGSECLSSKDTKFGVNVDESDQLIEVLSRYRDQLDVRGFSFHLSSLTGDSRAIATESALRVLFACRDEGLEPEVVNVGGGFAVNYLADRRQWIDYVSALKASVVGGREPITWNGNGFGMTAQEGVLRGAPQFPDFYRPRVMEHELEDLLQFPMATFGDRRIGDFLSEHAIELQLEPGKAMWDQCGLTIASVVFTKRSMRGEQLVALDMNRSNLDATDQEFFVDPIVISSGERRREPVGVYFTGNLCLSTEMITRHKVFLDALPQPGDLVVFPNTAGYFMDFTESSTLLQRTAQKVAVWQHDGELRWSTDERYEPRSLQEIVA